MKLFVTALVTLLTVANLFGQNPGQAIDAEDLITKENVEDLISDTDIIVDGKERPALTIDIPVGDKKSLLKFLEDGLEDRAGSAAGFSASGNTVRCDNCEDDKGNPIDVVLRVEKNRDGGVTVTQSVTSTDGKPASKEAQEDATNFLLGDIAKAQLDAIEEKAEEAEEEADDAEEEVDDLKAEIKELKEDLGEAEIVQKSTKDRSLELQELLKLAEDAVDDLDKQAKR